MLDVCCIYCSYVSHSIVTQDSFATSRQFLSNNAFRQSVSRRYAIPDHFWDDTYQLSNGFFGCQDVNDKEGKLNVHSMNLMMSDYTDYLPDGNIGTWFRFLIKQLMAVGDTSQHDYEWNNMAFFSTWNLSDGQAMFCFDVPRIFYDNLRAYLLSPSVIIDFQDIYSFHSLIVDEVIKLFDRSVWSIRDSVRKTEKVAPFSFLLRKSNLTDHCLQNRLNTTRQTIDFQELHESARHAIHSSETLSVAMDTINAILSQYEWFSDAGQMYIDTPLIYSRRTRQHFRFQVQMIKNLRARSEANGLRLHNEIELVSQVTYNNNQSLDSDLARLFTRSHRLTATA